MTWLELTVDGKTVSENMITFAKPKEMQLGDPRLKTTVEETSQGFAVTIQSEKPALWIWLGLDNADAKYADNFFHLKPAETRTVLVQPTQKLTKENFVTELKVRSLFDTHV